VWNPDYSGSALRVNRCLGDVVGKIHWDDWSNYVEVGYYRDEMALPFLDHVNLVSMA
jgi:hypothetical protein